MYNLEVSIVVVSLNTKNDFTTTIKSIISQTYQKFEIIVVDGQSSDGTLGVIEKFKQYFSKILIEKDNGIYDAMNKGLKLARGKWVIFLNSGDVFFENSSLEKIFEKNYNTADILFGNTVIRNENFEYMISGKKFDENTVLMPFCHQSTITKSYILKDNNFNTCYKISSDFNFFLNCYLSKKKFLNINMTIAKIKSGGVSDKERIKVLNENIDIIKKYRSNKIYKLQLIKISQYLKKFIKYFLPNFLLKKLLKLKYKTKIVR